MKPPVSHLPDPIMQAVPAALMRAAAAARRLAEQTGTALVVRPETSQRNAALDRAADPNPAPQAQGSGTPI